MTLTFESTDHLPFLVGRLYSQWRERQFCDVILKSGIDGTSIPAHRVILSAASDYFMAMFTGSFIESHEKEITLEDISGESLESLIKFCYTGNLIMKEETVQSLLLAANFLQINEAIEGCCKFMEEKMDVHSCVYIAVSAEQLNCQRLAQVATDYICKNFMDVARNEEFVKLSHEQLLKLLMRCDLFVETEEVVFESILTWVKEELSTRELYISEMLKLIRFQYLSPQYLYDNVRQVCTQYKCEQLFIDANECHLLAADSRADLKLMRKPRDSYDMNLIIIGGLHNKSSWSGIEIYCPSRKVWTLTTDNINIRRQEYGATLVGHYVVIVGGQEETYITNVVKYWDLQTKRLIQMGGLHIARLRPAVVILNDNFYAIGGRDESYHILNSVERCTNIEGNWQMIAPMNFQRDGAGVAILFGKIFVAGGRSSNHTFKSVESYNPETNQWTLKADMNITRRDFGLISVNGYLYALGGRMKNGLITNLAERYDPLLNKWSYISSLNISRADLSCAVLGNYIVVTGGFNHNNAYIKNMELYDLRTNTWNYGSSIHYWRVRANMFLVPKSIVN